jgi:hypothetical protein
MADTRVVRIDETLVATAEAEGRTVGRSTSAQLTYWARLGRAIEASGVPTSSIRAVLEQQAAFDDLSQEDQATVSALWAKQIDDRLSRLDMAAHHEASNTPYAELDDDGNVVVVEPTERTGPSGTDDVIDSGVDGLARVIKEVTADSRILIGGVVEGPGLLRAKANVHSGGGGIRVGDVLDATAAQEIESVVKRSGEEAPTRKERASADRERHSDS